MKALEKIKDMIDFCDATGCHRALYESLKAVETELEALQQRSCEGCKHLLASPRICLKRIQNCDGILPKDFCCNRYEPKEMR